MKDKKVWWVTQHRAGYITFKVLPHNIQGKTTSVEDLKDFENNIYYFSKKEADDFCVKLNEFIKKNYQRPSYPEDER
ncbi:MAG: hypothetical protein MJZ39_02990 [Bacteroidales bacterium]|nr:hypothetical protein [Bacteroidales bacterium]